MPTYTSAPEELAVAKPQAIKPPKPVIPNNAPPAHLVALDNSRVHSAITLLSAANAVICAQKDDACPTRDAVAEEGVRALHAASLGLHHQAAPVDDACAVIASLMPAHSVSTLVSDTSRNTSPASVSGNSEPSGEPSVDEDRTVTSSSASSASKSNAKDAPDKDD